MQLVQLCCFAIGFACACGTVDSPPAGDDDGGDDGGDPEGRLEITPPSVDFGHVSIALTPSAQTVVLTNVSTANVTPNLAFSGPDAARFQIERMCEMPIAPGAICAIDLGLVVERDGVYEASFDTAAGTARASATLAAIADAATMTVLPEADNFSDVDLAITTTRQYTLTNTGAAPLPMPVLSIAGDAAYKFGTTTCTAPLAPETFCTFTVEFRPVTVGTQIAVVTAATGTLNAEVQLTGRGTARLTVAKAGTGAGTVAGGAIACGASCAATVSTSPIVLAAAPAAGSRFATWTGAAAACGTNPTCSLPIVTGAVAVGATFADLPTLTLLTNGGGSVDVDNPGTSCDGDCVFDYAAPTTVRLTARTESGSCIEFAGWSGACAGAPGLTCTLTVNANLTTFAGFDLIPNCTPN